MLRHILTLSAGLAALALAAVSAEARPLELADWLDWERAGDARISPDGAQIVYSRSSIDRVNDRWDSSLWIMDANGEKHRHLVDGGSARWSPSGDRIAYLHGKDGDTGLYVRWMDAEGATSRVAGRLEGASRLVWSPDGNAIAYRARVPMKPVWPLDLPGKPKDAKWTEDPMVVDDLHYRMDRVGLKKWHNHIFIAPADGGTPRQITSGEWDVGARAVGAVDGGGALVFTPDGEEILFDGMVAEDGSEPEPFLSNIYAVSTDDGAIRRITQDAGYWHSPRVSPDGELVVYTGNEPTETNYQAQQLRLVGIDGADERVLIDNLPAGAGDLTWAADGDGIYYTVDLEGDTNVHYVELDGDHRQVTDGEHRLSLDSVSGDGRAVGIVTTPGVTRNVVRYDISDGDDLAQLTDLNADILHGVELGTVEEFSTDSSDATRVQGWIINPPDYDPAQSYPLLLAIHGGPHADYGSEYRPMFQFFAARGYVVVYSNPRGSTGYGPDFANEIDNRYPGRRDFDDLMAATDAAIRMRNIDTDRLFVQGCSGGGVLTSWTVTQTDRFAAAAARCPVINWISFTGQADISAWAHVRFRPPFWEDSARWLAHSPIMHVDKVTTPTLLMTGVKDLRTPLAQAEEFYAALKRLGVPATLIAMNGEWHGTSSKPSNMLRTVMYLNQWFARYDPARR